MQSSFEFIKVQGLHGEVVNWDTQCAAGVGDAAVAGKNHDHGARPQLRSSLGQFQSDVLALHPKIGQDRIETVSIVDQV